MADTGRLCYRTYSPGSQSIPVFGFECVPLLGSTIMDTGRLVMDDGSTLVMPPIIKPPTPACTINGIPAPGGQPVLLEHLFFDGGVGVIMVEVALAGADLTTIHHHLTGDILMRNHSSLKPTMMDAQRDAENGSMILMAVRRQDIGDGPVRASVEYDTQTQLLHLRVSAQRLLERSYHIYADVIDLCYDTTTNL